MSNTAAEPKPAGRNIVIERNGVKVQFAKGTFGKKSKKNAGKTFFYLPITAENFETTAKPFLGLDVIIDFVASRSRTIFQNIMLDNIKEDGTVNWENYELDCADSTAGADSLSDLKDQMEELQTEQFNVSKPMLEDSDFDAESEEGKAVIAQMKEIRDKIKPLRIKIDAIKERYRAISEKREATKKANEEAEKSQPAGEAVPA